MLWRKLIGSLVFGGGALTGRASGGDEVLAEVGMAFLAADSGITLK